MPSSRDRPGRWPGPRRGCRRRSRDCAAARAAPPAADPVPVPVQVDLHQADIDRRAAVRLQGVQCLGARCQEQPAPTRQPQRPRPGGKPTVTRPAALHEGDGIEQRRIEPVRGGGRGPGGAGQIEGGSGSAPPGQATQTEQQGHAALGLAPMNSGYRVHAQSACVFEELEIYDWMNKHPCKRLARAFLSKNSRRFSRCTWASMARQSQPRSSAQLTD